MTPPLLLVVALGSKQPDEAATAIIDGFVDRGFRYVLQRADVDPENLLTKAKDVGARVILLCPSGDEDVKAFGNVMRGVRSAMHEGVFDILAVGTCAEDVREGDPHTPLFVHPSEGMERVHWLADFIMNSLQRKRSLS